jgi:predicted RNase H-like HicB family nuclease
MNNKTKNDFVLTGIFIQDKIDGRYTAFFSELPEAVSQGESIEEAEENLFNILPSVMEVMNKANQEEALINGDEAKMTKRSYKFHQTL